MKIALGPNLLGIGVALLTGGQLATAQSPSAQDFAMAASQSDAYEIATAHVAEVESQNPAIRAFAQQMIHDHMMTTNALKAATSKSGLPPPPETPNPDQARMLYALQSLKGQEFDREYVTQQVVAHHGALAIDEQYARSGTDANLKQAAATAIPMIRHHLDIAEQLHSSSAQ